MRSFKAFGDFGWFSLVFAILNKFPGHGCGSWHSLNLPFPTYDVHHRFVGT